MHQDLGLPLAIHDVDGKPAPYDNLGLPWHPFRQGDVTPLVPGKPTLLRFDLLPTSIVFKAGHRIQVTLSIADTVTPRVTPAPTVSLFQSYAMTVGRVARTLQ